MFFVNFTVTKYFKKIHLLVENELYNVVVYRYTRCILPKGKVFFSPSFVAPLHLFLSLHLYLNGQSTGYNFYKSTIFYMYK
jgi:hypothetical protein